MGAGGEELMFRRAVGPEEGDMLPRGALREVMAVDPLLSALMAAGIGLAGNEDRAP